LERFGILVDFCAARSRGDQREPASSGILAAAAADIGSANSNALGKRRWRTKAGGDPFQSFVCKLRLI
jgi:hypothetical protein